MTHYLKTWPKQFIAVLTGDKRHEVRVNDRDFKAGDVLQLQEYDPDTKLYTGNEVPVRVTYITYGGTFGLPENLAVMSIGPYRSKVSKEDGGVTS